jgi:hypothetical protein
VVETDWRVGPRGRRERQSLIGHRRSDRERDNLESSDTRDHRGDARQVSLTDPCHGSNFTHADRLADAPFVSATLFFHPCGMGLSQPAKDGRTRDQQTSPSPPTGCGRAQGLFLSPRDAAFPLRGRKATLAPLPIPYVGQAFRYGC